MRRGLTRFQQQKLNAAFARADREAALRDQDGRCKYCLDPLSLKTATRDHKQPRSAGGSDQKSNIVASCAPCNVVKGAVPFDQFMRLISDPRSGEPMKYRMIWVQRQLNKALNRLEANIRRRMGLK